MNIVVVFVAPVPVQSTHPFFSHSAGVPAGQGLTCTVEELFDVGLPSMNIVISSFRYHEPLPVFFSVWGVCTVEELFDVGLGPTVTLLLALFVTMVFKSAWSDCRSRANSGGTICASKIQNDGNPVVPNFVYVIFDT